MDSFSDKVKKINKNRVSAEPGNMRDLKIAITISTLKERVTAGGERVMAVDISVLTDKNLNYTLAKLTPKNELMLKGISMADARRLAALEGVVAILKKAIEEC